MADRAFIGYFVKIIIMKKLIIPLLFLIVSCDLRDDSTIKTAEFSRKLDSLTQRMYDCNGFSGIYIDSFKNKIKSVADTNSSKALAYLDKYCDSVSAYINKSDRHKHIQDSLSSLKDQREIDNSKAGRIHKKHPEWEISDCERVANKEVWIGMSYEMLVYEKGKPSYVHKSNYGSGDEWQACWGELSQTCYYFGEDHIITSYN